MQGLRRQDSTAAVHGAPKVCSFSVFDLCKIPPRPSCLSCSTSVFVFAHIHRCVRALRVAGVGKGDRVAGVMVNSEEALVCMLGVTAVGAIWR